MLGNLLGDEVILFERDVLQIILRWILRTKWTEFAFNEKFKKKELKNKKEKNGDWKDTHIKIK